MKNKNKNTTKPEFEHLGYEEIVGGDGISVHQNPPDRNLENEKRPHAEKPRHEHAHTDDVQEKKIDEEIEQSFPASDPPSHSKPSED